MRTLNLRQATCILSLTVLVSIILAGSQAGWATTQTAKAKPRSAYWDKVECATCHQGVVQDFAGTRHGRAMEFGGWGVVNCQSCHGEATEHVSSADPAKIKNPAKMGAVEISKTCTTCHASGGHQQFWYGSAHETSNVSCLDCHSVHKAKSREKLLVQRTDTPLCLSCHPQVRRAQYQRSTHLFRNEWGDARVSCSSCHQPHGSITENLLRASSANDTCYACHQDKRGPFLWEHPPVKENCMNCHTAHGSNNPGLLTHRTTLLCQQCHVQGRHQTVAGRPNSAWVINRGCLNCHGKIHGSNHPSGVDFDR